MKERQCQSAGCIFFHSRMFTNIVFMKITFPPQPHSLIIRKEERIYWVTVLICSKYKFYMTQALGHPIKELWRICSLSSLGRMAHIAPLPLPSRPLKDKLWAHSYVFEKQAGFRLQLGRKKFSPNSNLSTRDSNMFSICSFNLWAVPKEMASFYYTAPWWQ